MRTIKPFIGRRDYPAPRFEPTPKKPGEFMLIRGKLVEVTEELKG